MHEAINNDDEKYLALLEQLTRYDMLLEQLQKTMSEGFINLGRANFHNKDSLRGRYGSDYYDESFEGLIEVRVSNKNKITMYKKNDQIAESKEDQEDSEEEGLKSRKNGDKSKTKSSKSMKIKDPINMFGAGFSIPSSLRQSQTNFKNTTTVIFDLINCKKQLLQDIELIQREKNGASI